MALPLDTEPLRAAVIAALTTYTGQTDCVPADRLFRLGLPRDLVAPPSGAETWGTRTLCAVDPVDEEDTDPQLRLTDRRRALVTVGVRCWYHCGTGADSPEYEAAVKAFKRDARIIESALTYPGALYSAPDGQRTGLDGGSIPPGRRQLLTEITREGQPGREWMRLQVRHVFRSGAEFLRS